MLERLNLNVFVALRYTTCLPHDSIVRSNLFTATASFANQVVVRNPSVAFTLCLFNRCKLPTATLGKKKWIAAIDISCVKVTFIAPSQLPRCFSVDRHSYGISFPIVGP